MNLAPIQRALDAFSAEILSERQKNAAKGAPCILSCSKGCSACCSEPAYAIRPEVLLILSKLSTEQTARVKERCGAWLVKARAAGVRVGEMPNAFEYRAADIVCPLLENGLCMAYHARPFGCRAHMATGPRIACEDLKLRPNQKFAIMPFTFKKHRALLFRAGLEAGFPFHDTIGTHLGILLAEALGVGKEK